MKPSAHELEKHERQNEGEKEDVDAADELDAHRAEVFRRQQPLLIMSQAEGNVTPKPAEQVRLGDL